MPHPDEGQGLPLNFPAAGGGGVPVGVMSLGEALAWLDRHVNLEAIESGRAGRLAAPTLARIRNLLDVMGDPQRSYKVIHVTGTNGKGSTVRMTTALLAAMGLSVGSYTSPHLERVNERLAWNGEPIADAALAEVLSALAELERVLPGLSRESEASLDPARPTWFELVTAAAYRWFADIAVEAAVVEVGLGGRFDATNAADGSVAVITNVELDHVDILGPTRADIAGEKAGIIKEGSIVVLGEVDDSLLPIFEQEASRAGAAGLWLRHRDFACEENYPDPSGRVLELRTPAALYTDLLLSLHGAYQGENAACALAAAEAFFGGPLDEELVAETFGSLRIGGRMEILSRRPWIVLDGAHNPAGARAAGEALEEDFTRARRVFVVMGCLRGRDPAELLSGLSSERTALVIACPAPSPRGVPPSEVAEAAAALGLESEVRDSVADAISRARELADGDDLVLVTGSLYVVGEARSLLVGSASVA